MAGPPQRSSEALRHAWDWFDLHSKQRMQTVNFYIILVGAILAGSGAALKEKQYLYSALLGFLLTLMSALFFAMDRRARVLVRVGESALRREEELLAKDTGNQEVELVGASDHSSKGALTYGRIFYTMFVVMGTLGIALLVASVLAQIASSSRTEPKPELRVTIQFQSSSPASLL